MEEQESVSFTGVFSVVFMGIMVLLGGCAFFNPLFMMVAIVAGFLFLGCVVHHAGTRIVQAMHQRPRVE